MIEGGNGGNAQFSPTLSSLLLHDALWIVQLGVETEVMG